MRTKWTYALVTIAMLVTQHAFAQQPGDILETHPLSCVDCNVTPSAACPAAPPFEWPFHPPHVPPVKIGLLHNFICTTPSRSMSGGDGFVYLDIYYIPPKNIVLTSGTAGIYYGNGQPGYQATGTSTADCEIVPPFLTNPGTLLATYRASNGYAAGYCQVRGAGWAVQRSRTNSNTKRRKGF